MAIIPFKDTERNRDKSKRYRYYVSNRLIAKRQPGSTKGGWRLPDQALEQQIASLIIEHLEEHLVPDLFIETDADQIDEAQRKLTELRGQIRNGQLHNITQLLQAAIIGAGTIVVQPNADTLADYLQTKKLNLESCTIDTAFQLRKRGSETKLIIGNKPMAERDQVLIDNIAKAHHYYDAIKSGLTFDQVAKTNNITKRRLLQIIDLTFLAPDFVKSILIGGQPDELTSKWLEKNPLPSN